MNEADNLNLNVTITYTENTETPETWKSLEENGVWVGHYKKKDDGSIVAKSIAETGTASTLTPKNIKVKGNSISFHIKSFSMITVGETSGNDDTSTSTVTIPYDNETAPGNPKANNWQIVSSNYVDDIHYTYSDDYSVRIRKKVEATGNENEFKIHLTVEPEANDVQSFWDKAMFGAVHNNSADLGGSVNTKSGWSPLYTEQKYQEAGEPSTWAKVQIKVKYDGEIFIQTRYIDTTLVAKSGQWECRSLDY